MEGLEAKADFSSVYVAPTPAPYLEKMRSVGYRIPDETKVLYQNILAHLKEEAETPVRVVDLGSSYGINSALLMYDLTMADLDEALIPGEERNKPDVEEAGQFFDSQPKWNEECEFYLVDTSRPALEFAKETGLCEKGFCVDLEKKAVPDEMSPVLAEADLLISTGCVGYVGPKTFQHILKEVHERGATPHFAFSILRMFEIEPIREVFADHEFQLLKSQIQPIPQRHFKDETEKRHVITLLHDRGISTEGLEDDGSYYADFYVGGPVSEDPLALRAIVLESE